MKILGFTSKELVTSPLRVVTWRTGFVGLLSLVAATVATVHLDPTTKKAAIFALSSLAAPSVIEALTGLVSQYFRELLDASKDASGTVPQRTLISVRTIIERCAQARAIARAIGTGAASGIAMAEIVDASYGQSLRVLGAISLILGLIYALTLEQLSCREATFGSFRDLGSVGIVATNNQKTIDAAKREWRTSVVTRFWFHAFALALLALLIWRHYKPTLPWPMALLGLVGSVLVAGGLLRSGLDDSRQPRP